MTEIVKIKRSDERRQQTLRSIIAEIEFALDRACEKEKMFTILVLPFKYYNITNDEVAPLYTGLGYEINVLIPMIGNRENGTFKIEVSWKTGNRKGESPWQIK